MPPKKKGGKGKKGKKRPPGPPIVTTVHLLNDRTKMLCPRMGDIYSRTIHVEEIMDEVVIKTIQKVADKQSAGLNLTGMKLSYLPDISRIASSLQTLTDLNLSKNNLFDGDQVFQVNCLHMLFQFSRFNPAPLPPPPPPPSPPPHRPFQCLEH